MGSQRGGALGRNDQIVRVLNVLRDLDRLGGVDLYELAERYGTTVRTIRRDLAALQHAGVPLVEEQDGKRKRWRVEYKDQLRRLSGLLDASHYLSLRLAMGQGGATRGSPSMFAALEDLSQKIETAVGSKGRAQLASIDASFHSYEKFAYQRAPMEVLWPLVQAVTERRVCRVTYRAPRREPVDKAFEVLPLRLFVHDGAVYLMCHAIKRGTTITLNLQRLRGLQVLEKRATVPEGFDPASLEDSAFGIFRGAKPVTYVLRFSADTAPYIRERTWHPSQRLRALDDGGVELEFTCGASYEVTAWVASWRDGVEVMCPAALRRELRELGERLVERYAVREPRGRRSTRCPPCRPPRRS